LSASSPARGSVRSEPSGSDARATSRSYGSGARLLSVGIAATGLFTFAYFSIASHVLGARSAARLDLLWSIMFVIISVIYRPIEQLLSRTIAERRARGHAEHDLRAPITIQLAFAALFAVIALVLRTQLQNRVFGGSSTLYYVLLVGTLAYAASYFARGWLAGHKYFGLYGGLVLMEAVSRVCFALAVAIGLASGQSAVALGIAAAPFVSLVVVPAAFARRGGERGAGPPSASARSHPTAADAEAALLGPGTEGVEEAAADDELSLRRGTGFALSVSAIMLAEQTLLNAAVLTVDATSADRALAGIVFNVLLIARAPLQLFQAIQTSLLPHLAGLEATAGRGAFARAIRVTLAAIAGFAAAVTIGLLAVGPFVMSHVFGQHAAYPRLGLALIGLGMGLHLASGTLNQAALARDQTRAAAVCWLASAAVFVAWMLAPVVGDQLLRAEIGYSGATAVLMALLLGLYRRGANRDRGPQSAPAAAAIAK
jgi:O-antigen/teichoic acid export membrane protein